MTGETLPNYELLKAKVKELSKGPADRSSVEARLRKLSTDGIPEKQIIYDEVLANKEEILNRVQKRAEEYEQADQIHKDWLIHR